MPSWVLFLLLVGAALLFRRSGLPWPAVVARLAAMVALSLAAAALLGGLLRWLG